MAPGNVISSRFLFSGPYTQPRTQALSIEKNMGVDPGLYTDQLQIEQARKGI